MAAYEERTDSAPGPSGGAKDASLDESYRSIPVEATKASRRFLAFLGLAVASGLVGW